MKKVQILIDNKNSWILPYANDYSKRLNKKGYKSKIIHSHEKVENGDFIVLLSCEKKFNELNKNKYNLVVHESYLPSGKGWSPLTYQVIEGKKEIPITLFEANSSIDGGMIYLRDEILLNGTELVKELREKQSKKTFELIDNFLNNHKKITPFPQKGEETFYKKRGKSDSELDINKTIEDNFNLLRVVDNEKYPAFFYLNNVKYTLKIYRDE